MEFKFIFKARGENVFAIKSAPTEHRDTIQVLEIGLFLSLPFLFNLIELLCIFLYPTLILFFYLLVLCLD